MTTATTLPAFTQTSEHNLLSPLGRTRYQATLHPNQTATPIVLVHGYGGLLEHWRRVVPLLAHAHPVYALDLHNFGYSSILPAHIPPSFAVWAEQVAYFIRSVVQQPAIVIGHSMGGGVSLQLAATHPDTVHALVLVNSIGYPRQEPPSLLERSLFGILQLPILGETLARSFTTSNSVRTQLRANYHRYPELVTPELIEVFTGPLRRAGGAEAYLAVTRNFPNLVLQIAPDAITQPTLIVWGEADHVLPPSLADLLRDLYAPHATIRLLADSGHCCFDEVPQVFVETVQAWLASVAVLQAAA